MALSGSQITRVATGGPGLSYAGFLAKSETEIVAPPVSSFAVSNVISSDGSGIRSNIGSTFGAESPISSDGLSVRSTMDNTGLGIESGF